MAEQNQGNMDEINFTKSESIQEANELHEESLAKQVNRKVISHPKDVAALVLTQLNNVNNKKDELTIAIKSLADITEQLVNAYAGNTKTIQQLKQKIGNVEN